MFYLSSFQMQSVIAVIIIMTIPHRCANLPASLNADLASLADLNYHCDRKGPFG